MARRGTKPQPDALKVLKGTFQPCRSREPAVTMLDGDPVPPAWLQGEALEVWKTKVDIYTKRRQSVVGCEGALAQYCALEANLITFWKMPVSAISAAPVALINAHRIYANEFYDTPASQHASGAKRTPENRFTRNGQQPAATG